MAYQLHPVAASDAKADPLQHTTDVVFVDETGNPIDVGSGSSAPTIGDGAVTTAKIADKAVTAGKLADGVIPAAYRLPAATANALGGVKLTAFSSTIGNAKTNVAAAAGDAPTKAEYDALKDAYNALASQFNQLIGGLANAGVVQLPS